MFLNNKLYRCYCNGGLYIGDELFYRNFVIVHSKLENYEVETILRLNDRLIVQNQRKFNITDEDRVDPKVYRMVLQN